MTAAVLDPLAPTPSGVWSNARVRVTRRRGPHRGHRSTGTTCTARFCVQRTGRFLTVEHDLAPDELSDELTTLLVDDLVEPGVLVGQSEFEEVFTGIVRSTVHGGLAAWLRFYRNSLDQLESGTAAFAPVHARAASEILGRSLIDLGSCFGFFPLRAAAAGIDVLATDLSASVARLLATVSTHLHRPLTTLACDATNVPLPDRSADTVTALHLIEHLPSPAADAVIDEAVRLSRRRVVLAVPFEDEPRECFGHLQRFDLPRLQTMAGRIADRHPGVTVRAFAFHGGWLVIDR